MTALVERNDDGTFPVGTSGNPNGRPKGRKNAITVLKQDLELAVREQIKPARIKRILDKMCDMAEEGNVAAGKLILDKALSNAHDGEDTTVGNSGYTFVIKNVLIQKPKESDDSIINVTPEPEEDT